MRTARFLPTRSFSRRPATVIALVATLVASVPAVAALAPVSGGGSGSLHLVASGPATINTQGKIVAWGVLPTPGRLQLTGKPGAFSVRIGGVLFKANRRGVVKLESVAGRFAIQGTQGVKMRIEGAGVDLSIAGRGSALPVGTGTYSLNGAPDVPWTGQPITIAPAPKTPPAKPGPAAPGSPGGR